MPDFQLQSQSLPEAKGRFFNCHAHCFTMDHVPSALFGRWMSLPKLLNKRWVKDLVNKRTVTGRMPLGLKILIIFLGLINLMKPKEFMRLLNMVRFGNTDDQTKVIEAMRQYYPEDTGLVFLTMDMEFMGGGLPQEGYRVQLEKLAAIKRSSTYQNIIYPFIFIDPRRIEPTQMDQPKDPGFTSQTFMNAVNNYLTAGDFHGLKIYPALGYYPFDKRMKPAYDLALKYNLPIITHCTVGAIHHKKRVAENERIHPVTGKKLPDVKPSEYQKYFTHPLNYECLMNKEHLQKVWGEDTMDYSNLKFCLGHWGSGEDWHRYLENDWADLYEDTKHEKCPALKLSNWFVEPKDEYKNFTWFTIILELLKSDKYPNIYTDISYTLYDATLLPLLKMMLEANTKVWEHVLFGTDFYMVSKAISEREYSINLRAYLGEELFHQIAVVNARRFLSSEIGEVV